MRSTQKTTKQMNWLDAADLDLGMKDISEESTTTSTPPPIISTQLMEIWQNMSHFLPQIQNQEQDILKVILEFLSKIQTSMSKPSILSQLKDNNTTNYELMKLDELILNSTQTKMSLGNSPISRAFKQRVTERYIQAFTSRLLRVSNDYFDNLKELNKRFKYYYKKIMKSGSLL